MKHHQPLIYLCLCSLLYAVFILQSGCAQVGMPTGGLKDTLPPVILKITPAEGTTNFTGNRIVLTFDEYVQLDNVQKNLIVSPLPRINPNVDFKLKTVTIRLRDTLLANTTYKIELGDAIRDINENNPIADFKYVFSTGNYIDSLRFSGNVEVAETGQPDSTLSVFLYDNLSDSAVFKTKPKFITRVNSKGDFEFSNLPPATYHVFALKDESGQRMYTSKAQLFAFADSAVIVNEHTLPVKLFAYAEEKEMPKTTSAPPKKGDKLQFVNPVASSSQDLLSPLKLVFNHPLENIDENRIMLSDTLLNLVPFKLAITDTLNKEVTLEVAWQENSSYKLVIDSAFARDTSGNILTGTDTLSFKTKREGDYGSVKITFKNLGGFTNPVLQFVKNKEVFKSFTLTGPAFSATLFEPGDYEIRILEDENKNGIWDPGKYDPENKLIKQPEKVIYIPQSLNIKAGWENERDIILSAEAVENSTETETQ